MGKAKAAAGTKPNSSGGGGSAFGWIHGRRVRKCRRWTLWILGPLVAAAAIAIIGSPDAMLDEKVTVPATDEAGSDATQGKKKGKLEAPPADKWAKPEECAAWAGSGQCKENPGFMLENCAFSCAKLDYAKQRYDKRCPRPENHTATLVPGMMGSMFERAMTFRELEPERISEAPDL